MILNYVCKKGPPTNDWVISCSVCGKKGRHRLLFAFLEGKKTICVSDAQCLKKIFPKYNEYEDEIIKVGKFRKNRDRGLECEKCGIIMGDGVMVHTKVSSILINKYKRGCCMECLGEVFEEAVQ
jgi:hypothetical protein